MVETFFAYNKDIDKTAYMNWRLSFDRSFASQFFTLADGFFETSIKMIDICLEDNSDKKRIVGFFLFCLILFMK